MWNFGIKINSYQINATGKGGETWINAAAAVKYDVRVLILDDGSV